MKLLCLYQVKFRSSLVRRLGVALCASALLASCGGGGNSGDTGTQVQLAGGSTDFPGLTVYGLNGQEPSEILTPWLVSVRLFRTERRSSGRGDAKVSTLRYNDSYSLQDHIDYYSGLWESDSCTIEEDDTSGGSGGSGDPPYVSGGQSVVLNTQAGTWYTINANSDLRYIVDDALPGALPTGTTLSIPGDIFPSVGAYPLYQPQPTIRISPGNETAVDIDSEYLWTPDGDPGTLMAILFQEYDADGNFIRFADMYCQVEDDGEFSLPIDALNFIASSQNQLRVRYDRLIRRIDYVDGVAFYQRSNSAD